MTCPDGKGVDADRGYHMRSHPTLGMDVFMYVDDPGVYMTAHCDPVPDDLAEAAGFPVEENRKKHQIKSALAAAQREVLDRYNENKHEFVVERGDFKIQDIGLGRFNVFSGKQLLNKNPISIEEATILLDHLSPQPKEAKKQ